MFKVSSKFGDKIGYFNLAAGENEQIFGASDPVTKIVPPGRRLKTREGILRLDLAFVQTELAFFRRGLLQCILFRRCTL